MCMYVGGRPLGEDVWSPDCHGTCGVHRTTCRIRTSSLSPAKPSQKQT